jgi:2-polyprenyl-3-methyl-5-hydroxy-6-metoxy-1,4-benzoquinol methylase
LNTDLVSYYKQRAAEYEKIYSKPERQADLQKAKQYLQDIFAERHVLEIACGTGYWTERIAETAISVFATDINEAVIEIAKKKEFANGKVSFGIEDIYDFSTGTKYESLFAGFLLSHIKLQELDHFFVLVNCLLSPGATVVFMDNNFVEGSNLPITYTDTDDNTYQSRELEDGTSHLVLKNFLSEFLLINKLKGIADNVKFIKLKYYWIASYTTR